ncbi:MAG: hypothetical protein HC767_01945 [Akkermansiaceae bacterium]|nr:hypothetical protein [Akkermansiaceae bacterium]
MSLADQAHTCRIGKQQATRAAILKTFSGLADDSFQNLTPAQLVIVLDIICMTHPEGRQPEQLLHEHMGNTGERAMQRIWGPDPVAASLTADDMQLFMSRTKVRVFLARLTPLCIPLLHVA